jgi:peptidoglycan/LPS O-acetylase OafA/YrhL
MQMTLSWTKQDMAAIRTEFRGDINGLRAWAVIAVILYHFSIPGFSGGFIGVDVFFVISGFLMTGIVIRGLDRGDFSIVGFYMARAKRIVPALAALCAVLLALGWFVLLPPNYKTLGSHSIYSLSFLSNIEYWQEAGYFDAASHEKWLLHTWSLSVEWQFYLLLPIALWGAWRLFPGRIAQRWTLVIGIALSLGASVLTTDANPTMAFYLLPTRAWEMLAGGLVFLLPPATQLSATAQRWIELAGLLLIVFSVAMFDKNSVWPGWRAAVPVSAAMLILAAQRASLWTGNPVAQWLGNRSYSLYLWHWPVFVSLSYIEHSHDPISVVAGLIVTLILGHFSYVGIENSARHMLGRIRLRNAAIGLLVIVGAVAMPGLGAWAWHGVSGRFPAAIELVADEANNFNHRRTVCHTKTGGTSPSCIYGGTAWKVMAIGDSHAGALVSGLAAAAPDANAGVVEWTYSGCAFVLGLKKTPAALAKSAPDYRCSEFIGWVETRLNSIPSTIPIVVIGRYAQAAFGPNEDRLAFDTPEVYFSKIYPAATPEFLNEFSKRITDSACQLAKRRTVYLMRPIPEMGVNIPKSLSRRMALGLKGEISVPFAEYRKRNAWVWAAQDAARDQCGIKILDPLPYLCHDGRCYGSKNGHPLYYDDDHMSESGNKLLVPMFEEVFKSL